MCFSGTYRISPDLRHADPNIAGLSCTHRENKHEKIARCDFYSFKNTLLCVYKMERRYTDIRNYTMADNSLK